MDTTSLNPEQVQALAEAVELVKPIVAKIENSPAATKNHYSDYMVCLSTGKGPLEMKRLAALLILAGANKEGVTDALKLSL
jgi:hypothetical protein